MQEQPIAQIDMVATMIAELASSAHIHDQDRGERRARVAAEALANEVAILAMMTLPVRVGFYRTAGKHAAELVRKYQ